MQNDDLPSDSQHTSKLTLLLAASTALVTCAIGWVAWTCIDSLQKHTGTLTKYHSTLDNTRVDTKQFDIIENKIDRSVSMGKAGGTEDFRSLVMNQQASERFYDKAESAIEEKHFDEAVQDFTQALAMIPEEATRKNSWFADGEAIDRLSYNEQILRLRSSCYVSLGQYSPAMADLNEAIKQRPFNGNNYVSRANVYYRMGKKNLGDADMKTANNLFAEFARRHPTKKNK